MTYKNPYASTGVFPGQSAIRSVTEDDLRKLTYRTTSRAGVPGRIPSEEDRGENFSNIHAIGRKDTKYLKYKKSKAPLLDHSALSSRRDFVPMPLGDHEINSQLAASFRGGLNAGPKMAPVEMKSISQYNVDFAPMTPALMRSAKQKSTRPSVGRTRTITGMTDMLETRPHSHVHFCAPPSDLAAAAEIVLAKPNLGLSGKWEGFAPQTSYSREFRKPLTASMPLLPAYGSEDLRPPELLPPDDPAFYVRRACYLSPGQ